MSEISMRSLKPFRQLAAISAVLCTGAVFASVDASRMTFDVLLDEKLIGKHVFQFEQSDGDLIVQSDVDMSVKLLFVEVFSYEHSAAERWRDGCLKELSSRTLQNGEQTSVQAEVVSEQLVIERRVGGDQGMLEDDERAADAVGLADSASCLSGYAYWDKARLDRGTLLNAQLGELDVVQFEADGDVRLEWLSRATDEQVKRYALTSNGARIELWYDDSGQWLGLRTKRGKRWLEYRLDVVEPAGHSTARGAQLGALTRPKSGLIDPS